MKNLKGKVRLDKRKYLLFAFVVMVMSLIIGNFIKEQTAQASGSSKSSIELQKGTKLVFVDVEEGKKHLIKKDDFIKSLSPFDRSARLKTDKPVSEGEFLEHITKQVLPWTVDEKNRIRDVVESISSRLKPFELRLPQKIFLIKTTGEEEGGAAYCRANAIVLPQNILYQLNARSERALTHELFHILSTNNPKLKEELYEVINFKKCDEIELPERLRGIKITNPDGIRNNHYVEVKYGEDIIKVVPIIYSSAPKYDLKKGGVFFNYLKINLLAIEKSGDKWQYKHDNNGEPVLLELRDVPDYFNKIGFNTNYVFHPEEILAENFILMVQGTQPVKSEWVIEEMRKLLQSEPGKTLVEAMDR